MTARRAILAVFSSSVLLGLAWGCSAADSGGDDTSGTGGVTGISEAGVDGQTLAPDGSADDAGGKFVLNRLCGEFSGCVPDTANANCATYEPPKAPGNPEDEPAGGGPTPSEGTPMAQAGAGGSGGEGGEAGLGHSMSAAGASGANAEAGAGGMSGAAGGLGAAGATGTPPDGQAGSSGAEVIRFGCQVRRVPGKPSSAVSECAAVGSGGNNAPCLTSSDCQPGFGCVGDQKSGRCQQYCCQSGDECTPGSYCAERPLRDETTNALPENTAGSSKALLIPVCVAAENCDLNAPYPCTAGAQCACKDDTACIVVRSDGTTTCAVPGTGTVGKACPCAWGHVCSAATNECLKLCYTRGAPSCGDGKCQAASELPDGWGVCVGVPLPR